MPEHETTLVVPPPEGTSSEELADLNKELRGAYLKASDGDPTELNRCLDKYPDVCRRLGDLARLAELQTLEGFWGTQLGKAPKKKLAELRQSLGYDSCSSLEGLLIERVVACWLQVQQAEIRKSNAEKKGVELRWATVWDRRLQMAHRNFLSACKSLAQVRRLLRPGITQVNIGEQQINVAQGEAGGGD